MVVVFSLCFREYLPLNPHNFHLLCRDFDIIDHARKAFKLAYSSVLLFVSVFHKIFNLVTSAI